MRLTPELVARVGGPVADPGPAAHPELVWCTDDDRAEAIAKVMAAKPATDGFWVFAYGSLIWKPAFESVEQRAGVLREWQRAFCLGWIKRFRGTPETPGLMMALDKGDQTEGVLFRLPPDAIDANLWTLFQREMLLRPEPLLPIWADIETEAGIVPALVFVIDRESRSYVSGLPVERIADVLAEAVGERGSMAEYLYETVRSLEDLDIHDDHLWELQEMVAERIEAAHPGG